MFTVRDAENAMITFTVFAIAAVVAVFLHEIVLKRNSITHGLYAIVHNVSEILSAATLLTLLDEGIDIMFLRRTREERRKQREERRKQREEGYNQAMQEFSERIAKEVDEKVARAVEEIVGKAKEEAYKEGYEAAKAEAHSQENRSG